MKKIVCLLLALSCMFALFACGGNEDDTQTAFFEKVENSNPTSITTQTTHTRPNGVIYNGLYTTKMTDNGFIFTYEYQDMLPITPGSDATSSQETKSGTIVYDGTGYSIDGAENVTVAPDVAYMQIKLELVPDLIGDYEMSADGKTLTAELSADDVKNIFGTEISASAATLSITVAGSRLSDVSLSYTTDNGTVVDVKTGYTYEAAQTDAQ